jgi:hypothetical protein
LEYLDKTLLDSDLEDAVQLEEFLRTKCDFYYSIMHQLRCAILLLSYFAASIEKPGRTLPLKTIRILDSSGKATLDDFKKEKYLYKSAECCNQLSEEAATLLTDSGFPSLFSDKTNQQHILFGPLSLVNHACDAPFGFHILPDTVSKDILPAALKWHKSVALKATKAFTLETGQEIVANYGDAYKFTNCWCESCRIKTTQ